MAFTSRANRARRLLRTRAEDHVMRIRGVITLVAILSFCAACNRKPAETTTGSTDTLQPTATGTTATETGTGAPVTNTATTSSGNADGSGGTSTNGTSTSGTASTTATTGSTSTY
jgi:hypothetical protein